MILVTGGGGFIGSVLVHDLNRGGHEDILIVERKLAEHKCRNIQDLKYSKYIEYDQLFSEENTSLLDQVTEIYHMGACSSTTERNMEFLKENNVEFSKRLFELALKKDIPFIYASSAATYGDGSKGYNDSSIEGLEPLNPYGLSKQLFDEWVLEQKETPSVWFGIKFFNVFGPNEYHKGSMMSLACKAYSQIQETGKVILFKSHHPDFADGEQTRDFVYVKDVTRAMIELRKNGSNCGIYNLGTGKGNHFKYFVECVFKALGKEMNVEFIPTPESIRDQYQYFTEANMERFSKTLPDFKFLSLEEAVKDYVQNHLDTDNPYMSSKA